MNFFKADIQVIQIPFKVMFIRSKDNQGLKFQWAQLYVILLWNLLQAPPFLLPKVSVFPIARTSFFLSLFEVFLFSSHRLLSLIEIFQGSNVRKPDVMNKEVQHTGNLKACSGIFRKEISIGCMVSKGLEQGWANPAPRCFCK